MDSFYSEEELRQLHFKKCGDHVLISRKAVFYNSEEIELGSNVRIDDFCFISGGIGIRIGNFVHIAAYSALYGKFGIEIGDYVNISSRVSVYSTSDDYSGEYLAGPMVEEACIHDIGRKVVIEKHVIIGTGSVLLPGTMVHEGVAIGAMSLVKAELQPFKVYAGTPVKYLKERSKKMLEKEKLGK